MSDISIADIVYGDVAIIVSLPRKDITVTMGDSMVNVGKCIAAPLDKAGIDSLPYNTGQDPLKLRSVDEFSPYVEVQFLKGLLIDDLVDNGVGIVFTKLELSPPDEELRKLLNAWKDQYNIHYQNAFDMYNFRIEKSSIDSAFVNETFSPKGLIDKFKQDPYLERQYKGKVGVVEGYSLEEHTEMLMKQFEKYHTKKWDSPVLTIDEFRLMLAFSDIGKPEAVKNTENSSNQHKYTNRILPKVLEPLKIPPDKADVIISLATQDYIGNYLQGIALDPETVDPEKVAGRISDEAVRLGIKTEDYFQLLTIYYMCDAGSYTEDAGGKKSLDFLFDFQKDSNGEKTMKFSQKTQKTFDILAGWVISEAAKVS